MHWTFLARSSYYSLGSDNDDPVVFISHNVGPVPCGRLHRAKRPVDKETPTPNAISFAHNLSVG